MANAAKRSSWMPARARIPRSPRKAEHCRQQREEGQPPIPERRDDEDHDEQATNRQSFDKLRYE